MYCLPDTVGVIKLDGACSMHANFVAKHRLIDPDIQISQVTSAKSLLGSLQPLKW